MRKNQNQNQNTATTENRAFFDGRYQIIGAKWDGVEKCRFSIRFPDLGITLYGLRLLYNNNTNEPFFAFPAFKGNNNKYYNYCYCAFSDSVKAKIVAELEEM